MFDIFRCKEKMLMKIVIETMRIEIRAGKFPDSPTKRTRIKQKTWQKTMMEQ
jgi:hypothetical protein